MQKIQDTIDALKTSPLFNLSLASKELFHSNFLAWVLEKKDDQALILLRELAEKKDFDLATLEVRREENNFDLTLMVNERDGTRYRIVIENKVKSIPAQAQLDEYSAKLVNNPKDVDKTIAILLSLTMPEFFDGAKYYDPENDGPKWRYHGYDTVVKCLEHGCSEGSYHGSLLNDYRGFVQNLINLQAAIQSDFDSHPDALINPFVWPQKDKSLYSQLKKIRMHDVFEKWRMLAIKKRIEAGVGHKLDIGIGFSRGTGILDIRPQGYGQKRCFMLQLQGQQLRQVLYEKNPKKDLLTIANDMTQWFLDSNGDRIGKRRNADGCNFCKYGDSFIYQYEPPSLDRLKELICKLIETPFP